MQTRPNFCEDLSGTSRGTLTAGEMSTDARWDGNDLNESFSTSSVLVMRISLQSAIVIFLIFRL